MLLQADLGEPCTCWVTLVHCLVGKSVTDSSFGNAVSEGDSLVFSYKYFQCGNVANPVLGSCAPKLFLQYIFQCFKEKRMLWAMRSQVKLESAFQKQVFICEITPHNL